MYQLLTGQLPFQGSNNYSMMYQITHAEPAAVGTAPRMPPALDAIVMRALQKSLDDRYPTWDAFSFDLAEAFRGEHRCANRTAGSPTARNSTRCAGSSFFRDFSDVELWEVVRFWATGTACQGGRSLLREGDAGDGFFILAEGEVKVTKGRKLLNVLSAGECVGEMAWLTPEDAGNARRRRIDTVRIHRDPSRQCLARARVRPCRHRFDRAFLRILVERLALANQRLTERLDGSTAPQGLSAGQHAGAQSGAPHHRPRQHQHGVAGWDPFAQREVAIKCIDPDVLQRPRRAARCTGTC
jgi:CRP-like cAMP-binding protein